MRTPSSLCRIGALLLTAGLFACGGGAGPESKTLGSADIAAAEQSGSLEALLAEATAKLADPELDPEDKAQIQAVKDQVGQKLAEQLAEQIQLGLEEAPRAVDGLIPVDAIETQREHLPPMRAWSATLHQQTSDQLSAEMKKTKAAIAERETQLASMADDNVPGKLAILEELGALAGAGSEAASVYAGRRKKLVEELNLEANQAIESENYEDARRMLEIVREVDPSDAGTADRLATVDTKVFEQDFFKTLEQGDADKGYALLTEISTSDSFVLIKPKLASSTDVMANYYVSLGAAATKAGNVPDAYRRFNEARNIRLLLGDGSSQPPKEEAAFVALVEKKFEQAKKQDKLGLAWGYLQVIQSMQSSTPGLRRNLRETREQLLQRAVKRLSVASFEQHDNGGGEYGDGVASRVVQHLLESIPNDVRMIEREQLEDIMREKKLVGGGELAAVDFLVHGTILEAKVDTSVKASKENRRVVTEYVDQTNPEYNAWLNSSTKSRRDTPAPPKTLSVPRKENVTIEIMKHRKVGLFSVSFRLIDAETAKVVFADSVRSKVEHEDTSNEGYTYEEFELQLKQENLPSDSEILTQLADQVADEIGAKIADRLASPEKNYAERGERYAREDNFQAAAQQFAYSIVLAERKNENVDELLHKLRMVSIASSSR